MVAFRLITVPGVTNELILPSMIVAASSSFIPMGNQKLEGFWVSEGSGTKIHSSKNPRVAAMLLVLFDCASMGCSGHVRKRRPPAPPAAGWTTGESPSAAATVEASAAARTTVDASAPRTTAGLLRATLRALNLSWYSLDGIDAS